MTRRSASPGTPRTTRGSDLAPAAPNAGSDGAAKASARASASGGKGKAPPRGTPGPVVRRGASSAPPSAAAGGRRLGPERRCGGWRRSRRRSRIAHPAGAQHGAHRGRAARGRRSASVARRACASQLGRGAGGGRGAGRDDRGGLAGHRASWIVWRCGRGERAYQSSAWRGPLTAESAGPHPPPSPASGRGSSTVLFLLPLPQAGDPPSHRRRAFVPRLPPDANPSTVV